jgi:hypothetical protein
MKVRTASGATVSIVAAFFMLLLFVSELSLFLTVEKEDHLFVDVSRSEKLPIYMDMTFHHIPCSLLSLDAMDLSGEHQLGVAANIKKKALNPNGDAIGQAVQHEVGEQASETLSEADVLERAKRGEDPTKKPGYCGPCYGAEATPQQCCNTCDEVRNAYQRAGWSLANLSKIEQCVASGETQEALAAELKRGDGCQIYGFLEVNRVAGNFHFAPGRSFQHAHVHVHDLAAFNAGMFNVSHTVNQLSFGEAYPGAVNPLDKLSNAPPGTGSGMFSYYCKVVPTEYADISGKVIATNQFSVTEHFQATKQKQGQALPGVFFFYELSPIMVRFTERRNSFPHFLTQLCAIIGGVFTVAGMIDKFLYHTIRHMEKKQGMGKLS